ncbi:hypothetical protein CAPTEDRAFT_207771 [Capitella teleta]|uniref:Uncharacterized protein n=1 Tax=Capitella teleta TaxID=283909 RepID=R7TWH6_CAPTE|nr:hypothetical protein CAPTEDRAFT_207771 [Capitella teleta]|eukprot:ELT98109.1 hypothetical protein CAPTEDRAFT_207771 [Capitella teleta]
MATTTICDDFETRIGIQSSCHSHLSASPALLIMDVVIDSVVRSSGGKKSGLTATELKRMILREEKAKAEKEEDHRCWCSLDPSLRHKMTTPSTETERIAFMHNRCEEVALNKKSNDIATEERVVHALGRAHIRRRFMS